MEKTYADFEKEFVTNTETRQSINSILNVIDTEDVIIAVHDGIFHADDVLSVAIVREYLARENDVDSIEIVRTRNLDTVKNRVYDALFILDVGAADYVDSDMNIIAFDHHQEETYVYNNGVKMAACGKIFSTLFADYKDSVKKYVFERMLYPVEAKDNGQKIEGLRDHKLNWVHELNLSSLEEKNNVTIDEQFEVAVAYAQNIFRRMLIHAEAYSENMIEFAKAVSDMRYRDKLNDVLIFNKGIPWMDFYFNPGNVDRAKFVIFPHIAKGYVVRTIPINPESFEQTYPLPKAWWGKSDMDLAKISGVPGAEFCHKDGFMAKWDTLPHAILAVEEAIQQLESSGYVPPDVDGRPKYVAVDFDGTLSLSKYVADPNFRDFKFNRRAIEVLKKFRANGGKLILWTCRSKEGDNATIPTVVEELAKEGLEFDAVNENIPEAIAKFKEVDGNRKISADFYIDDRAVIGKRLDWNAIDRYLNEG